MDLNDVQNSAYGKISDEVVTGNISINIPIFIAGGEYDLKLFTEQVNEENLTDYAETFTTISIVEGMLFHYAILMYSLERRQ